MVNSLKKKIDNELLIERELLAVLSSIKLKLERREAIYALINNDDEAPFEETIRYFIQGEMDFETSRKMWNLLLSYRRDMSKTYGDRVSLHIAAYHLIRDPQTLAELDLDQGFSCSKIAQALAIQELKAWWERCSETGVHLREVMDQQLERLVYSGLKKKSPVSLVLVSINRIQAKGLTAEERSEFARFLMDSCRCRDIVGNYVENLFALIFPQTPRQGARIAVDRLRGFFYAKYGQDKYRFQVAIANSPDNGRRGRDIALIAGDQLRKFSKHAQDSIIECEGEPAVIYQWWAFYLRKPFKKFIKSPLQLFIAIVLVMSGSWAVKKMNFEQNNQWNEVLTQKVNESKTIPRWRWGRGMSEVFPLDAADGFIENGGTLVCESGENLWFQFPFIVDGEFRLYFFMKMALGTSFSVRVGNDPQSEFFAILFEPGWFKIVSKGIVMEAIPLTFDLDLAQHVDFNFSEGGLSLTMNDQLIMENGRWGKLEAWPQQGYISCQRGNAMFWGMRVLSRNSAHDIDWKPEKWAEFMANLAPNDPSPWAENLLRAPARLETVLRANLERQLISMKGDDLQARRRALMETWGEGVLGGAELWSTWLHRQRVSELEPLWGHELIQRSPTLKQIFLADQSKDPVDLLRKYTKAELWGVQKASFLQVVLALDWEEARVEMGQWAWIELIGMLEELSDVDAFKVCTDFLKDDFVPDDPIWTSRICEKMIFLGKSNPLEIYHTMAGHPLALATIRTWPKNFNQPLLMLLQARAMETGPEKNELINSLSSWMNNNDIGKVLKLDWMWLKIQNEGLEGRESQFMQHVLKNQSRRPELARQAQLLGDAQP